MQKLKLKKKQKEILPETNEWKVAISKVASMLDVVELNLWKIGDIAKKIPTESGRKPKLAMPIASFTPLQLFSMEVAKKTKKYKNWQSAYSRIRQARALAMGLEPEERVEELPLDHHALVLKHIPEPERRYEKLVEAKEKKWTAEQLYENIAPKEVELEETAMDVANDILGNLSTTTDNINRLLKEMNFKDLSKSMMERLMTSIGVLIYKPLAKLVKKLEEHGAKPDKNIMELLKKGK